MVCLRCRKRNECRCEFPIPSKDGRHPWEPKPKPEKGISMTVKSFQDLRKVL